MTTLENLSQLLAELDSKLGDSSCDPINAVLSFSLKARDDTETASLLRGLCGKNDLAIILTKPRELVITSLDEFREEVRSLSMTVQREIVRVNQRNALLDKHQRAYETKQIKDAEELAQTLREKQRHASMESVGQWAYENHVGWKGQTPEEAWLGRDAGLRQQCLLMALIGELRGLKESIASMPSKFAKAAMREELAMEKEKQKTAKAQLKAIEATPPTITMIQMSPDEMQDAIESGRVIRRF